VLTEQGTAPSDDKVTEAAFWIAHALYVWVVEAEAGERDHRETLNRLGDLTPPDQPGDHRPAEYPSIERYQYSTSSVNCPAPSPISPGAHAS